MPIPKVCPPPEWHHPLTRLVGQDSDLEEKSQGSLFRVSKKSCILEAMMESPTYPSRINHSVGLI